MKKEKICIRCNQPFIASHYKQKYCIVCGKEKRYETNRRSDIKRLKLTLQKKKCKYCGDEFETYYKNKSFCKPVCFLRYRKMLGSHVSNRDNSRPSYRNWNDLHPGLKIPCRHCGKIFKRPDRRFIYCCEEHHAAHIKILSKERRDQKKKAHN